MRAGASRSERSAHGQVAAGKLTDIAFDDEMKRFVVSAKESARTSGGKPPRASTPRQSPTPAARRMTQRSVQPARAAALQKCHFAHRTRRVAISSADF
jgi:hypothetical protein